MEPRPAVGARVDELVELTHGLWKELIRRGEFLPSSWVEEAAHDLSTGRLRGWVVEEEGRPAAVAFYSVRGPRAYGHVHLNPSAEGANRAQQLMDAMLVALPESVVRLDTGVTGLSSETEHVLGGLVESRDGSRVVVRWSMHRPLEPSDAEPVQEVPGIEARAVGSISIERLTALDVRAFRGSPDESLVAESFEEDRRVLSEILDGLLGRFLGEASRVLVSASGELAGALLTGEQTSRTAVYLDLIIDPSYRRRGLATYLARWGFRALLALGYESVRLWVTESNRPARQLYESLGFEKVDQAMIFRWDRPGRQLRPGTPVGNHEPAAQEKPSPADRTD